MPLHEAGTAFCLDGAHGSQRSCSSGRGRGHKGGPSWPLVPRAFSSCGYQLGQLALRWQGPLWSQAASPGLCPSIGPVSLKPFFALPPCLHPSPQVSETSTRKWHLHQAQVIPNPFHLVSLPSKCPQVLFPVDASSPVTAPSTLPSLFLGDACFPKFPPSSRSSRSSQVGRVMTRPKMSSYSRRASL